MQDAITITPDGRSLNVRFDRYDLDAYALFLRAKRIPEAETHYDWRTDAYTVSAPARFARMLGVEPAGATAGWLPLATHLFDYQRWIVELALESKRFACWCDTGLGKTAIYLEWARQVSHLTGGRVLIFTANQVVPQVPEMAAEFYRDGDGLPIERIESRAALAAWCQADGPAIGITNHHKMVDGVLPELRYLAGVALDEASILRSGGGKIKWNLIKSCRGIEYKLTATATPAPNDAMEYASQASFLEKLRNEGEVLWTYFTRTKAGDWVVKPHAREAFYQFMATWSVYMRDPAHFGFADILSTLPPPDVQEYQIPLTEMQREMMNTYLVRLGKGMLTDDRMGVQERSKLAQLAKGFLYDNSGPKRLAALVDSNKPAFVAGLVRSEVAAGRQTLIATVFDEESSILAQELAGSGIRLGVLDGSMSDDARLSVLRNFRAGALDGLISKASLIGYGLNLQFCRSIIFSGFDDSFERMYQFIRRCYRFGQTETVHVHVPYVPELEGMMFSNVKQKEARFFADVEIQEAMYRKAMMGAA